MACALLFRICFMFILYIHFLLSSSFKMGQPKRIERCKTLNVRRLFSPITSARERNVKKKDDGIQTRTIGSPFLLHNSSAFLFELIRYLNVSIDSHRSFRVASCVQVGGFRTRLLLSPSTITYFISPPVLVWLHFAAY